MVLAPSFAPSAILVHREVRPIECEDMLAGSNATVASSVRRLILRHELIDIRA
jgi:hypothetical protein